MNRIVEFRAKNMYSGNREWIYGYLMSNDVIFDDNRSYGIDKDTVCQHIFLQDKNGKDAYVGDIFIDERGVYRTIMQAPGGFACESNPVSFGYGFQQNFNPLESLSDQQTASWFESNCEICGNIFDNADLLCQK